MNPDEGTWCVKKYPPRRAERLINFTLMNLESNTSKIAGFLEDRLEQIEENLWKVWVSNRYDADFERTLASNWVEYLNGIDCDVVDNEEIVEEFENLFNYSSRSRVCISLDKMNRKGGVSGTFSFVLANSFVLMPRELAEKSLVLGGLPDRWFSPESSEGPR